MVCWWLMVRWIFPCKGPSNISFIVHPTMTQGPWNISFYILPWHGEMHTWVGLQLMKEILVEVVTHNYIHNYLATIPTLQDGKRGKKHVTTSSTWFKLLCVLQEAKDTPWVSKNMPNFIATEIPWNEEGVKIAKMNGMKLGWSYSKTPRNPLTNYDETSEEKGFVWCRAPCPSIPHTHIS